MPDEKIDDSLDAKEIPIHKKRIHTANDDSSYEEAWKPVGGKPPVNGPYHPPPKDPSLLDHDEEQLSELELQYNTDGTVKLEFVSHNRKHRMLLRENTRQPMLSQISTKFLGLSEEDQQNFEEELKVSFT